MKRELIFGALSYALFFAIAAHPFFTIPFGVDKLDAQDITNWLTAGLAVTTVWLGAETRKMAIAAKASIDLETRPYLAFRGFFVKIGALQDLSAQNRGALRIGLRLFNPGKVLVTYEIESILVTVNGKVAVDPTFTTKGGVIHPTEENLFFYPVIPSTSALTAPAIAEVQYGIAYWAIPTEKKTLSARVQLLLTSENDHEWTYLEGPHYA